MTHFVEDKKIFVVVLYICNINTMSPRVKLYWATKYISISRYRQKKIKVLQQGLCIVRYVQATVHSPAHSGLFGTEMRGWRMLPCQYNAEVNNLKVLKNYIHLLDQKFEFDFLLMIDVKIFFLVCLQASILIKTSRHYNDMDGLIHIVVSNNEKHVKQSEKYKRWTLPFSLL